MISTETFVYIILVYYIIGSLCLIHSGVTKSDKSTNYGDSDIFLGLIILICTIVALMW